MARRRKNRRGVILLMVVSLLVLFVLIAVTFAVIAMQYRNTTKTVAKFQQSGDPPSRVMDRVMYELVRGSRDIQSPMRVHELLGDFYSVDGFKATILSAAWPGAKQSTMMSTVPDGTAQQFLDIELDTTQSVVTVKDSASTYTPSTMLGFYNGCVLTITGGVGHGISTMIVGYEPYDRNSPAVFRPVFRVVTLSPDVSVTLADLAGAQFIVNGRPFNGTGFGYDPSTGALDKTDASTRPLALLPNRRGESDATLYGPGGYAFGGGDESHDALDLDNIALAAQIPVFSGGVDTNAVGSAISSFHRPELINYWYNLIATNILNPAGITAASTPNQLQVFLQPYGADNVRATPDDPSALSLAIRDAIVDIKRKCIFRPLPEENRSFSGSNPSFSYFSFSPASLDVDTDGDGYKDSIWIDPGFPTQTAPDGRLYKVLAAIHCTDLGGRIDLNHNGQLAHTQAAPTAVNMAGAASTGTQSSTLGYRGQGYGPPEINPGASLFSATDYSNLLTGRYGANLVYGANSVPGAIGFDSWAQVKFFEFPINYFTSSTVSAFSSPPDLFGRLKFGLDSRGMPIYELPAAADERGDSPYEFSSSASDARVTPAELERLLRANDLDRLALPPRLMSLSAFNTDSNSIAKRRAVTVDSYDVPCPNILSPAGMIGWFNTPAYPEKRPLHISDLLRARGVTFGATQLSLLPPELFRGVRMDINRPFGNGLDNNGNQVADDHGVPGLGQLEDGMAETIWTGSIYFDHDNDGYVNNGMSGADTNAFMARQFYARHLYVLAMSLVPPGIFIDFNNPPDPTNDSALETARGLAQWAVNVVDFRDADSIITPFEYDTNPFNGWTVDGDPGTTAGETDRGLVWGCERPELLLSENLAIHERRTEDLMGATIPAIPAVPGVSPAIPARPGHKTTTDATMPDAHYDQRLRPRGSLFVELYNPWTSNGDRKPGEFYYDGTTWQSGVKLNQINSYSTPVWRLIVVKGGSKGKDSSDSTSGFAPTDIDRSIYFTDPSSATPAITGDGARYYPTAGMLSGMSPYVLPGNYAVIGRDGFAPDNSGGNYVTKMGRATAASGDGDTMAPTRRIVLSPNTNTSINQVSVFDNGATGDNTFPAEPTLADKQPAVAIVVPRLSISEPIIGYSTTRALWDPALANGEGAYDSPIDEPLDWTRPDLADGTNGPDVLRANRTIPYFREVQLQRLANPFLPFDAARNPYLTIDSMGVDLTVFNGLENAGTNTTSEPGADGGGNTRFFSLQRGDHDGVVGTPLTFAAPPPSGYPRNLWKHEQENGIPAGDSASEITTLHYFNFTLRHSLGYMSHRYWPYYTASNAPSTNYKGGPNSNAGNGSPFPWLTWNNRPFVSQYELMQVPKSSSFQLLREFSLNGNAATISSYSPTAMPTFSHLLNFFQTSSTGNPPTTPGTDLYRLFEYLHVPSRFVETEKVLNTATFQGSGEGTFGLHPPFNILSNYRDPGKVNLNTIFSSHVYNALMNGFPTPTFAQFIDSRRGFDPSLSSGTIIPATLPASMPTLFANPFRAAGSGNLAPLPSMKRPDVECTIMRSDVIPAATTAPVVTATPRFEALSGNVYNDTDRNSYFRYDGIQRLANLTTTRSNTYAVWITIGYFQVESNAHPTTGTVVIDAAHPDGLRLGQEIGLDDGTVQRHRAFYLIDRSIPVAYEPGENHNVDRAILVRRFIE